MALRDMILQVQAVLNTKIGQIDALKRVEDAFAKAHMHADAIARRKPKGWFSEINEQYNRAVRMKELSDVINFGNVRQAEAAAALSNTYRKHAEQIDALTTKDYPRFLNLLKDIAQESQQFPLIPRQDIGIAPISFQVGKELPEHLKEVSQTWGSVSMTVGRSQEAFRRIALSLQAAKMAASGVEGVNLDKVASQALKRFDILAGLASDLQKSVQGLSLSPQAKQTLEIMESSLRGLGRSLKDVADFPGLGPEFDSAIKQANLQLQELKTSFGEMERQASIAIKALPKEMQTVTFTADELNAALAGAELPAEKLAMLSQKQRDELHAQIKLMPLAKQFAADLTINLQRQLGFMGHMRRMGGEIRRFFEEWSISATELAQKSFMLFISYMNLRMAKQALTGVFQSFIKTEQVMVRLLLLNSQLVNATRELSVATGASFATAGDVVAQLVVRLSALGFSSAAARTRAVQLAEDVLFLGDVLKDRQKAIQLFTQALGGSKDALAELGVQVPRAFEKLNEVERARRAAGMLQASIRKLRDEFGHLANTGRAIHQLSDAWEELKSTLGVSIAKVIAPAAKLLSAFAKAINSLLSLPIVGDVAAWIMGITLAFLGLNVVLKAIKFAFIDTWAAMKRITILRVLFINTIEAVATKVWHFIRGLYAANAAQTAYAAVATRGWRGVIMIIKAATAGLLLFAKAQVVAIAGWLASLGPVGWGIAGVAALIAILSILTAKVNFVRDIFLKLWQGIQWVVNKVIGAFQQLADIIVGPFRMAARGIMSVFNSLFKPKSPPKIFGTAYELRKGGMAAAKALESGFKVMPRPALASSYVAASGSGVLMFSFSPQITIQFAGVTDVETARQQAPMLAQEIWDNVRPYLDRYLLQLWRGGREHRPTDERRRRP